MKKTGCFVCNNEFPDRLLDMNKEIMLPVCPACKNTDNEKKKVIEYLDSLAEGFVCGCI
jgi:NAD-dependent SIR2 family protein deacetylase